MKAAKTPKLTKSQRGFLERPPERSITPTAKSMAKAVMPKRVLGKPNTSDCQVLATLVQLTKGFKLQGKSAVGFLMSSMVSKVSKKEAKRPMIEPIIKI